ncbi:hypothetical protein GCM10009628_11590 [Paeniglutamicibacter kerguelensis]
MLLRGPSLAARMSAYSIEQIQANAVISVKVNIENNELHGDAALKGIEVRHAFTHEYLALTR